SGKFSATSEFSDTDHRRYNRYGEKFDVGETFSGVDYETGLRAVDELRGVVPSGASMAQTALRWTLMFPEVSAAIPGARNATQVEATFGGGGLAPLSDEARGRVSDVYDRHIRSVVHGRW